MSLQVLYLRKQTFDQLSEYLCTHEFPRNEGIVSVGFFSIQVDDTVFIVTENTSYHCRKHGLRQAEVTTIVCGPCGKHICTECGRPVTMVPGP